MPNEELVRGILKLQVREACHGDMAKALQKPIKVDAGIGRRVHVAAVQASFVGRVAGGRGDGGRDYRENRNAEHQLRDFHDSNS